MQRLGEQQEKGVQPQGDPDCLEGWWDARIPTWTFGSSIKDSGDSGAWRAVRASPEVSQGRAEVAGA